MKPEFKEGDEVCISGWHGFACHEHKLIIDKVDNYDSELPYRVRCAEHNTMLWVAGDDVFPRGQATPSLELYDVAGLTGSNLGVSFAGKNSVLLAIYEKNNRNSFKWIDMSTDDLDDLITVLQYVKAKSNGDI